MEKRKPRLLIQCRKTVKRHKHEEGRKEVMPAASDVPNLKLLQLRYEFEDLATELEEEPHAVGERVKLRRSNGKTQDALVEEVKPANELCNYRYTVVIQVNKLNPKEGGRFRDVKHHRLFRPEPFFGQQQEWLDTAAKETGFDRDEIPFRLEAMNRQLKNPPKAIAEHGQSREGPKKTGAYKNTPPNGDEAVQFPLYFPPWKATRAAPKKRDE